MTGAFTDALKAKKKSDFRKGTACMKTIGLIAALLCAGVLPGAADEGDAAAGARAFRACAACHSLETDRNMTGPSLAGIANRKAGSLATFPRYSDAIKQSGMVWNTQNLDRFLEDPAAFIPGNHMTFPGIPDQKARANIIAYLNQSSASEAGSSSADQKTMPQGGGGMGEMRSPMPLKTVGLSARVQSISYCRDTFKVTTQDGKSRDFWERNLRFKTDSSEDGPNKGVPAIVAAGMMGDRASVIFASPDEMAQFITSKC
jgi:cytochrome c